MHIYGLNPVREALKAGRVREIRVADRSDDRVRQLLDEAAARGIAVRRVTRDQLERDTRQGVHQGVMAEVESLPPAALEDFTRSLDPPPLLVILDEVEDPQNVGAILRTVDAAGATGVIRQSR